MESHSGASRRFIVPPGAGLRFAAFGLAYALLTALALENAVFAPGLLHLDDYTSSPAGWAWTMLSAWNPLPGGGVPTPWSSLALAPFALVRAPLAAALGAGTADLLGLLALVALGGIGAAALVMRRRGAAFAFAFGAVYAVNPLTLGWLTAGQFGPLVGWLLLPWCTTLSIGRPQRWVLPAFASATALLLALCPPFALAYVLAGLLFAHQLGYHRRELAAAAVCALAVNAYWLFPAAAASFSPAPTWWPPAVDWRADLTALAGGCALTLALRRPRAQAMPFIAAAVAMVVVSSAPLWWAGGSGPGPERVQLPSGFETVAAALGRQVEGAGASGAAPAGLTLWLPMPGGRAYPAARWSGAPSLDQDRFSGSSWSIVGGATQAVDAGSALATAGVRYVVMPPGPIAPRVDRLAQEIRAGWPVFAHAGQLTAYRNPAWRAPLVTGPTLTLVTGDVARLVGTAVPAPAPLLLATQLGLWRQPVAEIIDPALHTDRFLKTAFGVTPISRRLSAKGQVLVRGPVAVAPGSPLVLHTEPQPEEPLLIVDSDIPRAGLRVAIDGTPIEVYDQIVSTPEIRHTVMFPPGNGTHTVTIDTATGLATIYAVAEVSERAVGEARSRTLDDLATRHVTFVYDASELALRTTPQATVIPTFAMDAVRFGSTPWALTINGTGLRSATIDVSSWHGDQPSHGPQPFACPSTTRCTAALRLFHHGYADQVANGGDNVTLTVNPGAQLDSFVASHPGPHPLAPNRWAEAIPAGLSGNTYLTVPAMRYDPGWGLACADRVVEPFPAAGRSLGFELLRPAARCALTYRPQATVQLGQRLTLGALAFLAFWAAMGYLLRKPGAGRAAGGNLSPAPE